MATLEDVKTAVEDLKQHVANEAGQVSAALRTLSEEVDRLRVQVATGGAASALELDGVLQSLKAVTESVDAIIPDGVETQGSGGPGEENPNPNPDPTGP